MEDSIKESSKSTLVNLSAYLNICINQKHFKKMKKEARQQEKIFSVHILGKGLISRKYKQET